MRVSREEAEKSTRTVIDAASHLFREHGYDGVGVNGLMQAAGLTHGGFYKKFRSKADLASRATQAALSDTRQRWEEVIAGGGDKPLVALVRSYLSPRHRDARASGCPFAALGADAARQDTQVRRSFEKGMDDALSILQDVVDPAAGGTARDAAITTLSMMVGALLLSRAVEDRRRSDRILEAAVAHLLARSDGTGDGA
jgi:TetR/AcrR family transcriptional regulator, transcriptional repressor for nem operon